MRSKRDELVDGSGGTKRARRGEKKEGTPRRRGRGANESVDLKTGRMRAELEGGERE